MVSFTVFWGISRGIFVIYMPWKYLWLTMVNGTSKRDCSGSGSEKCWHEGTSVDIFYYVYFLTKFSGKLVLGKKWVRCVIICVAFDGRFRISHPLKVTLRLEERQRHFVGVFELLVEPISIAVQLSCCAC